MLRAAVVLAIFVGAQALSLRSIPDGEAVINQDQQDINELIINQDPQNHSVAAFRKLGTCLLQKPTTGFVINLKRRPDRWAATSRWLGFAKDCITTHREEATDGKVAAIDENLVKKEWDTTQRTKMFAHRRSADQHKKMTAGELGCATSHAKLWQRVAQQSEPVLIMEDDIFYRAGFQRRFSELMQNIPQDADVIYLSHAGNQYPHFWKRGSEAKAWQGASIRLQKSDYLQNTAGYVVTPQGARKLAASLPVKGPVDDHMAQLSHFNQINAYGVLPRMIFHKSDLTGSDIEHGDPVIQLGHDQ